ncbi:M48 family metallopeptidase [Phaeocystidibacter luteus]|uniref:M48 family metalloprotease n=1 Tax=Phaeocystidibacter luteus TaxID=911197 RepID=A0A6N6RHZ7_9FLAO|nr:M48 family metallopeptidase [Phaeocystidibacter luteus]KAB2810069.1 M48 family metalloprotease [Phaeocystidibacter luteus]
MIAATLELTPHFKKQAKRAAIGITIYILVYLLTLLAAVMLAIGAAYAGIMIIVAAPSIIGLVVGVSVISVGLIVLGVLVGAFFRKKEEDKSIKEEITEHTQPELFKLIYEVAEAVGTDKPNKVYLTPAVNAAVMFNSSFWSMFVPTKRNLIIGLPLLRAVTVDELKGILAHEFGHFSQNSMRVGSYVYNLNMIVVGVLQPNERFKNAVSSWASFSIVSSLFSMFAIWIVGLTQKTQIALYDLMNKRNYALSREMEFQADTIGAKLVGAKPMIRPLVRLSMADSALQMCFGHHQKFFHKTKELPRNVFDVQFGVMRLLAEYNNVEIVGDLPQPSLAASNVFNGTKLKFGEQWATHPDLSSRVENIEKTAADIEDLESPIARVILRDPEELEVRFTKRVFEDVYKTEKVDEVETEKYLDGIQSDIKSTRYPEVFQAYFGYREPRWLPDAETIVPTSDSLEWKELFNPEIHKLAFETMFLEQDKDLLIQLSDKSKTGISTFEYDGRKYKWKEASALASKLSDELRGNKEQLSEHESRMYKSFANWELQHMKESGHFGELWNSVVNMNHELDVSSELTNKMFKSLEFSTQQLEPYQIEAGFRAYRPVELKFKKEVSKLLEAKELLPNISEEIWKDFNEFVEKKWSFFNGRSYNEENLRRLYMILNDFMPVSIELYEVKKRKLLNYMDEIRLRSNQSVEAV